MVKYKDYYDTLGVPRTASDKDIKSAYRKLARQHHPDANPGDKVAEEKFKEITEAYEVLKDPEKRRRYDMLGSNWKAGAEFRPPPEAGGFAFDFGNLGDLGKGSPFSDFFEILFGQTFGPGGAGGRHPGGAPPRSRRGPDQEADIELSVEELVRGARRTIQVSGPGMKAKTLEVTIPAGMRGGKRVRIGGEGAPSMTGGERGDLYLKVKVKPHPIFSIEGDNVVSILEISPARAVLGGESSVTTVDGPVKVTVPPGTQNGRMLRLKGKGLPRYKQEGRGDHMIKIRIVIPAEATPEEKALYRQLLDLEESGVRAGTGA